MMFDEFGKSLSDVQESLLEISSKIDKIVEMHAKNSVARHKNLADLTFRTSGSEETTKRIRDLLWAYSIEDGNVQNLLEGVTIDIHGDWCVLGKLNKDFSEICTEWEAVIKDVVSAKVRAEARATELTERLKEHAKNNTEIRDAVWAITGGKCFYCEIELVREVVSEMDQRRLFHVDHIVPQSLGGPDHLANYVPACHSCNSSKHARHFVEFVMARKAKQEQPQLMLIEGGAA